MTRRLFYVLIVFLIYGLSGYTKETSLSTKLVPIAKGWAKNQINATIFRRNSVVTHNYTQYAAFYDADGTMVLAKRIIGSGDWTIRKTPYKGNVRDAHNGISIMVDGEGYLHIAWNHHGSPLHYCRSVKPGSLELTEPLPMTGDKESRVTYPDFYRLPNGNLVFIYRDGSSGQGDLMLNLYDTSTKTWTHLQDTLIDGEGERNAYWQAWIDSQGTIHLSWVWRETGDVATNHDLAYAKSTDGGHTWTKSNGETYDLPINIDNAEYAMRIPQGSELINQTSMCADSQGNPYIATYWRPEGTKVPQFHVVYHDGQEWHSSQVSQRQTSFSLSGFGTRRIPISRPKIVVGNHNGKEQAIMLFRDEERGSRVSAALCDDLQTMQWRTVDLTDNDRGFWEPTIDTELWKQSGLLHIFVQKTGQGQGETTEDIAPQMVSILEWDF